MADPQPNVLLIVGDQHRADCAGFSGTYPVQTPALDSLAADGTVYTSAFTPAPLCVPARSAMICGQRPEAFGCWWNYDQGLPYQVLEPAAYSWARELQRAGYRTGYLGKWHVSPEHGPTAFGYSTYLGLEAYQQWRLEQLPECPIPGGWLGGIDPAPLTYSRTHWLADRASEHIVAAAAAGEPWHLRVDFVEPHLPCTPCAEIASRYDPAEVPPWPSFGDELLGKPYIQRQQLVSWGVEGMSWGDWAPVVARYYAAITQLDDAIGVILGTLERTGQGAQTMVVYTADHGDMCGSHGMVDKHYVMYDDVVRVPLVVRWPNGLRLESRVDDLVLNALDLPPTIAEVTGVAPPPTKDGRPLGGRQRSSGCSAGAPRSHVVCSYNGQQFGAYSQRMICTREWKYVWNATDVDELYELGTDPAELVNRIGDPTAGDVVRALRRTLYAELEQGGDGLISNEWLRRQLLDGAKLPA